ncbi:hypothetical protein MAPG_07339 [Magnaporthiopsis poae ATCC 64411]|uniref:Uncharacterized protein n=1 Tax=Magnaporthiopsis poae (strain ATCC 64411 / 73-15) TaxID=644358 RepID=A0A0C4E4E6_MAGP6|nr:hypothetical protein MAPG_07339 [Magnaporthiopsis poae ATCC 64411]
MPFLSRVVTPNTFSGEWSASILIVMDGLLLPRVILLAAATVLCKDPHDTNPHGSPLLLSFGFGLMQVLSRGREHADRLSCQQPVRGPKFIPPARPGPSHGETQTNLASTGVILRGHESLPFVFYCMQCQLNSVSVEFNVTSPSVNCRHIHSLAMLNRQSIPVAPPSGWIACHRPVSCSHHLPDSGQPNPLQLGCSLCCLPTPVLVA